MVHISDGVALFVDVADCSRQIVAGLQPLAVGAVTPVERSAGVSLDLVACLEVEKRHQIAHELVWIGCRGRERSGCRPNVTHGIGGRLAVSQWVGGPVREHRRCLPGAFCGPVGRVVEFHHFAGR